MRADIIIQELNYNFLFECMDKGIVGVFGPSGSGKSQFLDCLSKFRSHQGYIQYPPMMSKIVYMNQYPVLFPHWKVHENVEFVLKHNSQNRKYHNEYAESLNCVSLKNKLPGQLSGGEYQRVALMSSLLQLQENCLWLLDEPFSALDHKLKKKAEQLIERHKNNKMIFLVSHDLNDMYFNSHHMLVINDGKIVHSNKTKNIMHDLNSGLPLASKITSNTHTSLVYATDIHISLQQQSNTSIQHQIPCKVDSIHELEKEITLFLTGHKESNKIVVQITKDSYQRLNISTNQTVFANFKELR